MDQLIGRPHYDSKAKTEVRIQEATPQGEFTAERSIELGKLADREGRHQLTEVDKARAMVLAAPLTLQAYAKG